MTEPIALDELYQEIILDHFKHPRHFTKLADDEVMIEEENPTCGDLIRLTARVEGGVIKELKYEAKGCAISMASASMMADALVGKPVAEAKAVIDNFVASMKGEQELDVDRAGDLVALEGAKRYPLRIKCVTMSWHAAEKALT